MDPFMLRRKVSGKPFALEPRIPLEIFVPHPTRTTHVLRIARKQKASMAF